MRYIFIIFYFFSITVLADVNYNKFIVNGYSKDDKLYISLDGGYIYSYDIKVHQLVQKFRDTKYWITSLQMSEGKLYAATNNGYILIYQNNKLISKSKVCDKWIASMVIKNEKIYLITYNYKLIILNQNDMSINAKIPLNRYTTDWYKPRTMIVDENEIVIGMTSACIITYNIVNKKATKLYNAFFYAVINGLAADNKFIYAISSEGKFLLFNKFDKTKVFSRQIATNGLVSLCQKEGKLYFGDTKGNLYMYRKNGREFFSAKIFNKAYIRFIENIDANTLAVGSSSGEIKFLTDSDIKFQTLD